MNVHYEYIDRLKGLAIILVVMGHVLLYCCCSCDFPRALTDFIGKGIYSFHMPLFMFLSGIVVSDFPHASKLRRKLPQWLVPCVVIGLIYTFTIGDSVRSFVTNDFKGGYWYLFVLSEFYVILSLCFLFPLRFRHHWLGQILLGGGIMVALRVAVAFLPPTIVSTLSLNMAYGNWMYFFAGFFVRQHARVLAFLCNDYVEALCLVGIVIYFAFNLQMVSRFFPFLPIGILICAFRRREQSGGFVNRQLSWIGKNTLYIYVLHYFLLSTVSLKLVYEPIVATHNFLAELLVILAVSLVLVYISSCVGRILRRNRLLNHVLFGVPLDPL
jgi:fucose 4-O-acetylase-like acetyltransferase